MPRNKESKKPDFYDAGGFDFFFVDLIRGCKGLCNIATGVPSTHHAWKSKSGSVQVEVAAKVELKARPGTG